MSMIIEAASIAPEVFRTLLPDHFKRPEALLALTAPVLALGSLVVEKFFTPEKIVAPTNPDLLEYVASNSNEIPPYKRLSAVLGTSLLLGLTGASFSKPTVESSVTENSPPKAIIVDTGFSMSETADMDGGDTRLSVVQHALESGIKEFNGGVAVIAGADSPKQIIGFGSSNSESVIKIKTLNEFTDKNGNNLGKALDIAESAMPTVGSISDIKGDLLIISDGTVSNPNDVNKKINFLSKSGYKVSVVIPGTNSDKAYYELGGSGIKNQSNISTSAFVGSGAEIKFTTNEKDIKNAILERSEGETIKSGDKHWPGFEFLAGLTSAGMFLISSKRFLKRSN